MKKAAFLFVLIIFGCLSIFAEGELRQKAEENPLDCALFLLSKDKNSVKIDEFFRILVKEGRYEDALSVIENEDNSYRKFGLLVAASKGLIDSNKTGQAG